MRAATIAAVATPGGPAERGVIRLSGPRCGEIVRASSRLERALTKRGIYLGRFHDGRGEQPLLCLWMPAPHSYTREDVAELHLPGSPWLLAAALSRVLALGARAAEPGEFTRRAFESGRIDLLQAEGVLELVEAENAAELRAGLALLSGGLGQRVEELRELLEQLRALCEASLDFDEQATGHVPAEELRELGRRALSALDVALAWERRREPLAGLPRVVLSGPPNAGKSALFNALAEDARALESDLAGTTRDVLRALWRPCGVACLLVDTAGLDLELASRGALERRAQERARAERDAAELVLWVEAADAAPASGQARDALCVLNKCDLAAADPERGLPVSARTGQGLDALARAAAERLRLPARAPSEGSAQALGLRHRRALELARARLEEALEGLAAGLPLDLVAEGLRGACDALDGIQGRTSPEDLLDRIFARFCLGK
jgi:tRNA modification GTPase